MRRSRLAPLALAAAVSLAAACNYPALSTPADPPVAAPTIPLHELHDMYGGKDVYLTATRPSDVTALYQYPAVEFVDGEQQFKKSTKKKLPKSLRRELGAILQDASSYTRLRPLDPLPTPRAVFYCARGEDFVELYYCWDEQTGQDLLIVARREQNHGTSRGDEAHARSRVVAELDVSPAHGRIVSVIQEVFPAAGRLN